MIFAFDPSSTCIGFAVVDERLVGYRRVRALGSVAVDRGDSFEEREDGVWVACHRAVGCVLSIAPMDTTTIVAIERPGGGARADYGPRNQATIADAISWVGGTIGGMLGGPRPPLRRRSSDWRPTMLLLAQMAGLHVLAPGTRPPATARDPGKRQVRPVTMEDVARGSAASRTGHMVGWAGCLHERHVADLQALRLVPPTCPLCERAEREAEKKASAGQERTEEWKRLGVEILLQQRPDLVEPLIVAARSRARTRTEPSQLAGVADACEAAHLGLTVAEDLRSEAT